MSNPAPAPCSILIVEDSPEDFEAVRRTLKDEGLSNPVYWCEDGDSALDYLFHRAQYSDPEVAPRPGLILLDLTLPATDGRDVLIEIKSDNDLRSIPVVVMTSSSDERDIENSYRAGANSYLTKPVDLVGLVDAIRRLKQFWFEIVVLPRAQEQEPTA